MTQMINRKVSLPPLLAELSQEPERAPGPGAALLAGASAAGLGIGALVMLATALWICSPYPDSGMGGALHVAAALWLLAHGVDLTRPDTLSGIPAPVGVTPLLLAVLPMWLAYRAAYDAASPEPTKKTTLLGRQVTVMGAAGPTGGHGAGPCGAAGVRPRTAARDTGAPAGEVRDGLPRGGRGPATEGATTMVSTPQVPPSPRTALFGVMAGYLLVAGPVIGFASGGGLRPAWSGAALSLPLLLAGAVATGVCRARARLRASGHALVPRRAVAARRVPALRRVAARRQAAALRHSLVRAGEPPQARTPEETKAPEAPTPRSRPQRGQGTHAPADTGGGTGKDTDKDRDKGTAPTGAIPAAGPRPPTAALMGPSGRALTRRGLRAATTAAGTSTLVLLCGGALVALVPLVRYRTEVGSSWVHLADDGSGRVAVVLLALALVPNAAVWGAAFALGPGVLLGVGRLVAPLGVAQVPWLPGAPRLPVLPAEGYGVPLAWVAGAVPLAAGLTLAWRTASAASPAYGERDQAWGRWRTVLVAVGAAALCGAAVAGLSALAGGPMGVHGLARLGPVWWQAGGAATAWTLAVGLPTVLALRAWRVRPRRSAPGASNAP